MPDNEDKTTPEVSYDFISEENRNKHLEDYNKGKQDEINKLYGREEDQKNRKMEEAFAKTLRANGIFEKSDMDFNSKFYRFPRNDPFNYVNGAREYIFITKVDLPMLDAMDNGSLAAQVLEIPYFKMLWDSPGYRTSVFANLCRSLTKQPNSSSPFINILSNRKTSNLDIPDITVDAVETSINDHGTRIFYPNSSIHSDEDVDFSIEFEDTNHLDIYHLFKAYDVYRKYKKEGILGPGSFIESAFCGGSHTSFHQGQYGDEDSKETIRTQRQVRSFSEFSKSCPNWAKYANYIQYKNLYDHFALYKFLVADDGYTILFGYKIIGFYPSSIPRSAFSEIPQGGPLKLSIGFKVSGWVEDSDLNSIAADFNEIVLDSKGVHRSSIPYNEYMTGDDSVFEPFYQSDDAGFDGISQDSVSLPLIRRAPETINGVENEYRPYYLMWIK